MRRLPILVVITFPLALEPLGIPAAHPKFGLFQVNCFRSGIKRPLNSHAQELPVICARAHIVDVSAMADLFPAPVGLRLILMIDAVESPVEIILVVAPGNSGHHMNAIAAIAPRLDSVRKFWIDAINDRDIRTKVSVWTPAL